MTPAQFLARAKKNDLPPVCLFLGQESYNRSRCREALLAARGIQPEQFDMAESSLAAVIDDARAMSLFSSERLMKSTRRALRQARAKKRFSPPTSKTPRPA